MSPLNRLLVPLVVGLTLGTVPARGQQSGSVAGCYVFTSPYFAWMSFDAGTFTSFRAESPLVELLPEPVLPASAQPGAHRLAVPGLRDTNAKVEWYRYSNWHPVAPDSVGISWWNGHSGTHLTLRAFRDSLVGTSSYDADLGNPNTRRSHTARPALARRVPCTNP